VTLFLLSFFLVYGGVHLYAFLKLRAALHPGPAGKALILAFMTLMVLAPVIIRQAEKHGLDVLGRALSYVGYSWMGFLFLFFSAAFAIDLLRLLLSVGTAVFPAQVPPGVISPRTAFFIPLAMSAVTGVYGFFEAADIRSERVTIATDKVPEEVGRVTIAQISDVHIGLIVREERLKKILGKVRDANPDILVSTGDLVDGQINQLDGLSELFREIRPTYGMFAITGNHEFYAGLDQALDFTGRAGFTLLRGEAVDIGGFLTIAGVDDPTVEYYGGKGNEVESTILRQAPEGRFTVLLKHRPLVDRASDGLFDLQLSGHVHKGQIYPFSLLTRLYYPVYAGMARTQGGSILYVNRGSGTWGPPMRVLAPPEVTIIELVNPRGKGESAPPESR